jgi:hypothetical protein
MYFEGPHRTPSSLDVDLLNHVSSEWVASDQGTAHFRIAAKTGCSSAKMMSGCRGPRRASRSDYYDAEQAIDAFWRVIHKASPAAFFHGTTLWCAKNIP